MPVTATSNVRDICEQALEVIGQKAVGESSAAEDMDVAVRVLNRTLKAMQVNDQMWVRGSQVVALAADVGEYALTAPARPLRVLSARYRDANGTDLPMQELTRDEYESFPIKTTKGIPTTFWYDRQKEQGTVYVWPVLASRTTETLRLTIIREIEDVTGPNDALDLPAEWYEAVVYRLAVRLCANFGVMGPARDLAVAEELRAVRSAQAGAMPEALFLWGGHE